jgi:hypothetical protein
MVTSTIDCKRKGEKPRKYTSLYFVDGDKIMTVSDGKAPTGGCSPRDEVESVLSKVSDPIGSDADATWAVDGDMLTILVSHGFFSGLGFERA